MASQQSAQVYITNQTDGTALIQLYHKNSSNGTQSGAWIAAPGQTVGPLTVRFETGFGTGGIFDYWWVRLSVMNGSKPGVYNTAGSAASYGWKECQLQHQDASKTLTFTVDTTILHLNLNSGGCSNGMNLLGPYRQIANVFVLMLENHSFDNLFAMSRIPGIYAATTNNKNSFGGKDYPVQSGAPTSMPTDPGHEFPDVVEQLCGAGATYLPGSAYPPINNSGFAANYATTTSEGPVPAPADIGDIMKCFDTSHQLPVIYQLATEFALCDQWFSSLPGPTWPNRFFVHGASSSGLDHSPSGAEIVAWETVSGFTYPHGSLFDALNKANVKWRIYNDREGPISGAIPQVTSLKGITLIDANSFANFEADLHSPFAYQYTFIEPNYGDITNNSYTGGTSQHPMDGVTGGENLLKATYEAIRNSPLWYCSLLIVTYDEHGGFYDSFAPGSAVAPGDGSSSKLNKYGFTFTQYGVRVPAVVISPYVAKGVVDHTIYDHASVPATLERMNGLPALTQRDANANDVRHLISLASPRTDCPVTLNKPALPTVALAMPSPALAAAVALQPVPDAGSLPGFLGIMLKTELELSGGTDAEKAAIIANFKQVKTRGDAQIYIEKVSKKLQEARVARANK